MLLVVHTKTKYIDESQLAPHVTLFISRTFPVLHYLRITASEKKQQMRRK